MSFQHLSNGGYGYSNMEEKEFYTRRKIASCCNTLTFIRNCIAEKVLPKSAPQHIRNKHIPFTNSAKAYLEEACQTLKEEIILKRDECKGINLTRQHKDDLRKFNTEQQASLNKK